ncbi:glutathione S-transferase family protein [Chlorogloea sp. CCALA 695]|uniref:glutathione S-transferase family protein n=1 Tax=Chlorogloea sp. CCALA 695 TaxID=2107693 RepID=UPI000D04F7BC|nr:glutathione S-transferase family protein [Chlorogloea sp. CCALA 695]PSB32292.1 glutathione S-transferase [Chlorogloea sp. CCALA 695]
MLKLYDLNLSGNCYKVRLMLSLLGLEHELVAVNLSAGEHKSSAFLTLNPLGQVPILIDGDVVIRDSQAILVYLARRYGGENWLPLEAAPMAKVGQWLSTAANEIQHSVAAARLHFIFNAKIDLELARSRAFKILQVMDEQLRKQDWLEGNRPTIADIACFPYIALAADGKIALEDYPHVIAWISRIKQLPGYVGMPGL